MTNKKLLEISKSAMENSYPLFRLQGGAALLCSDGTVTTGVNVENISTALPFVPRGCFLRPYRRQRNFQKLPLRRRERGPHSLRNVPSGYERVCRRGL